MLIQLINNSYSVLQTVSRWYWSASTQQQLLDLAANVREVVVTLGLVLSHCYRDGLALVMEWLADCDLEATILVQDPCDNIGWDYVVGLVMADISYGLTMSNYLLGDVRDTVVNSWYHMVSVITAIRAM